MILKKQVSVQFMDSPLQGKTTLLTLDFQHQVSQALQPPIHWILSLFLQRIFEVVQKKPFYSSYVTRLKTYTSKERGVCAKTPNFQTAHQQLQFFLIGISKLIHTIIFKNILRHHYLLNILLAVYLLLLLEKSIAATIGKTGTWLYRRHWFWRTAV